MKHFAFINIVTALIVLLFTYTGLSKIVDHAQFHFALSESPLIQQGADIIAIAIPAAELLTVLLLLFSRTKFIGLWISLILLILFTGYLLYMILFALHLPCTCGGVISKMSWKEHLLFNVVFIAMTITTIRMSLSRSNNSGITDHKNIHA
jgi:hypothetical protein